MFGATAVALCVFCLLFLAMELRASMYDEGIVLTSAMQMMHGEVVHRDFHSEYGPGSYAVLAALFSLFSPSFLLARLFALVVESAIATMVFVLLRSRTRAWIAYGTTAVCVAWLIAGKSYLYPTFPCLALALGGAMILLRSNALRSGRVLFAAGCCCGLSAYFRYDTGFFTLIAYSLAIGLGLIRRRSDKVGFRQALHGVVVLCTGAAAIFTPGVIAYLLTSPFQAFYADIVDYPLKYYARMRGLPFPRFNDLLLDPAQLGIYLPLCAVAIALPMTWRDWLAMRDARSVADTGLLPPTWIFSLLALVLYYKGVVRVSVLHMLLAMVPALVLLALVVDRWWSKTDKHRLAAVLLIAVTALPALAAVEYVVEDFRLVPRLYVAGLVAERVGLLPQVTYMSSRCPPWPGMRFAWLSTMYAPAAYYIARHSEDGERIFVVPYRSDKFFTNPLILYFATDRLPGTRYAEYDPGLQNREDIQRTMIDELSRDNVRFVVRDAPDHNKEPNESTQSSGVRLLDNYIDGHYRSVGESEKVQVLLRNDVPAPPWDRYPPVCR